MCQHLREAAGFQKYGKHETRHLEIRRTRACTKRVENARSWFLVLCCLSCDRQKMSQANFVALLAANALLQPHKPQVLFRFARNPIVVGSSPGRNPCHECSHQSVRGRGGIRPGHLGLRGLCVTTWVLWLECIMKHCWLKTNLSLESVIKPVITGLHHTGAPASERNGSSKASESSRSQDCQDLLPDWLSGNIVWLNSNVRTEITASHFFTHAQLTRGLATCNCGACNSREGCCTSFTVEDKPFSFLECE